MTTAETGGFWNVAQEAIKEFLESGTFWGAAIGLGDPEWRQMSEEFAFWLRDRFDIRFEDEKQREYAERIFGATRGALERIINNKLRHEVVVVLAEKILIDGPDFAATILFADPEEFAMRRALRSRAMVRKGLLTQEEMERGEEAIGPLYDETLQIMSDFAKEGGKPINTPSDTPWSGDAFKKMLRQTQGAPDSGEEVGVHEAAKSLKDKLLEINDAMGKRVLRLFGLNPDPELQKELDAASDERNRAHSRLDQLRLIADRKAETTELNAMAAEAAQAVRDAAAGLPVPKERIYESKRRWRKRNRK